MNFICNIIWLIFGGFVSAIGYFFGGLVLCCTIIGIPFGLQCFKIGLMVLMPFGSKVVSDSSNTGCLSIIFNIIWLLCGLYYTKSRLDEPVYCVCAALVIV